MNTKLTLKLDSNIIDKAKNYAASHQKSLSGIIESYLQSLTNTDDITGEEIQISPFVRSMSSDTNIPADLDYKQEYFDHLTEKHK